MLTFEIVAQAELQGRALSLVSAYDPLDKHGASALAICGPSPMDEAISEILRAADPINAIWPAADGTLWASAASGRVWTDAGLPLSPDPPEFETARPGLLPTALPRIAASGVKPVPTALWGSGRQGMVVITFEGSVFTWNGAAWSERWSRPGSALARVCGVGLHDFVVTADAQTVIRFIRGEPHELAAPDGETPIVAMTVGPDGKLWAGDAGGLISVLESDGFKPAYKLGGPIGGLAAFGGALFAATGRLLWQIDETNAQTIRDDVPIKLVSGGTAALRIVPDEPGQLRFIEYSRPVGKPERWRNVELPILPRT